MSDPKSVSHCSRLSSWGRLCSVTARLLFAALAVILSVPAAHADTIVYTLNNVQIGTELGGFQYWTVYASGDFSYDTSTQTFTNISLSVSNAYDNGEHDSVYISTFPATTSTILTLANDPGYVSAGFNYWFSLRLTPGESFGQVGALSIQPGNFWEGYQYQTVTGLSGDIVAPEPASLALLSSGLIGLAGLGRRRKIRNPRA